MAYHSLLVCRDLARGVCRRQGNIVPSSFDHVNYASPPVIVSMRLFVCFLPSCAPAHVTAHALTSPCPQASTPSLPFLRSVGDRALFWAGKVLDGAGRPTHYSYRRELAPHAHEEYETAKTLGAAYNVTIGGVSSGTVEYTGDGSVPSRAHDAVTFAHRAHCVQILDTPHPGSLCSCGIPNCQCKPCNHVAPVFRALQKAGVTQVSMACVDY